MEKDAENLEERDQIPSSTPKSPQRPVLPRFLAFVGVVSCLWLTINWLPISLPKFSLFSCHRHAPSTPAEMPSGGKQLLADPVSAESKVPLEAHIMSKCPDARDCIRELIVPTMEKVDDKVDFKLSFIAEYENALFLPSS